MAQARHGVVGRLEVHVRDEQDAHLQAGFHRLELAALLVQQVRGDLDRHLGVHGRAVLLHRLFLDDAQDVQGGGFDTADVADAVAARAGDVARLAQRRLETLTREFHEAEARNLAHLDAGAVVAKRVAESVLDVALVLGRLHVDVVDHDEAAEVTQAQLARDLVGGFEVRVERGRFDVHALGGTGRVHVDGHEGFGVVDHDGAPGRQRHLAGVRGLDLVFDLEAREERDVVGVELDPARVGRHHVAHEHLHLLVDRLVVDQDLADVRLEVVTDRADDEARLFEDQERCGVGTLQLRAGRAARLVEDVAFLVGVLGRGGVLDGAPELEQVLQIPFELFDRAADAGSAGDDAHALRDFELGDRVAQFVAFLALDPAGHTTAARIVRHQDDVASGEADEGREGRALVAAFVLLDLDDDLLAFAEDVLDAGLADVGAFGEVLAADLLEREKAVAIGAVVDERRFETGLDAGDDALVDIALALLLAERFDIEIDELLAIDDCDADLLRMRRIEQHSFHVLSLPRSCDTGFADHDTAGGGRERLSFEHDRHHRISLREDRPAKRPGVCMGTVAARVDAAGCLKPGIERVVAVIAASKGERR